MREEASAAVENALVTEAGWPPSDVSRRLIDALESLLWRNTGSVRA